MTPNLRVFRSNKKASTRKSVIKHSTRNVRKQHKPSRSRALPLRQTQVAGSIKRHPDGFGFLIPEDPEQPDVYIPKRSMEGVMTNDKVLAMIQPEPGGTRWRGEIVRIVSRGTRRLVGRFKRNPQGAGGILRDEGRDWGEDLVIGAEHTLAAKQDELVAAEILTYPNEGRFTGRIVDVLGDSADPMTDIKRVILTQHIPHEWPASVAQQTKGFPNEVTERDFANRVDLRKLHFVTIDGATAKDFDDAIYVERNPKGFVLYVAIADVSHYVKLGSAIDQEAYQRGTSVYLPNFVEPMLPETLSNKLCSLMPKVPRLALVAEMHLNSKGAPQSAKFYEAVICSQARLTYGDAQEMIEGGPLKGFDHVYADVIKAAELARLLMERRTEAGSLDLEIPEIQLVVDATGKPVDILRSERLFSHRLIEEMMLAANVAVATFLSDQKIPALYRIHEPPPADAIAQLSRFLRSFGSKISLEESSLQKHLTRALREFDGTAQAQILNILTLRSMSQAKYSQKNLGHFGLGFKNYTHFTSPIRRYPDLIVHRLIKNQIGQRGYQMMTEDDLATAGLMLSACEQRAVKAERQIQAIKKARFMEQFVGQEFDGIVSSVTKFGVFVLLRRYEVDGLVPLVELSDRADKLQFDEDRLRLVARGSGLSFEIGDAIRVRIEAVDIELGRIDFVLASKAKSATMPKGSAKPGTSVSTTATPKQDHRGKSSTKRTPERGERMTPLAQFIEKKSRKSSEAESPSDQPPKRDGAKRQTSGRRHRRPSR